MKKKEKVSLAELREIAVLSACIPQYKAMGFKNDSRITRLSAEMIALIEYAEGGSLKELNKKIQDKVNAIRFPILEGIDTESLSEEEKIALSLKINKAINADEEIIDLKAQELTIWNTEITKEEIDEIEIEEREYAEKFIGPAKEINILYGQFTVDGYQALLALIAKGYIEIK